MRRLALLLLLPSVVLVALVAGWTGFAQQNEKGVLADLISKALSSSTTQVSIGDVEGALSSDATIHDLVISDREGAWLKLDRARLVWSRLALLRGRLEVNRLEIGRLEVVRKPAPLPPAEKPPASNEPLLPQLPVKVVVEQFALADLALGAPVAGGVPARLAASGSASLGTPSEGLNLSLEAHRLDAAGAFSVALSFVPDSQALKLAVKLDEPGEGLIARVASLPGLPPVKLDLTGDGKLDDFDARLQFAAGPDIGANGALTLKRQGSGRRLTPRLDARIAGLLPPAIAPVFAGDTRLGGTVDLNDDSSLALNDVSLVAALARLDVNGTSSADKTLALHVTAAAVPNADGATRTDLGSIGRLAMNVAINGPAAGPAVDAILDAADIALPTGKFGSALAKFTARPNGALAAADTRLAIQASGTIKGLALVDPALASALGPAISFDFSETATPLGQSEDAKLALAAGDARFDYAGALGPERIAGTAKAALTDLARFSGIAGRTLAGSFDLTAKIDGAPKQNRYDIALDGRAAKLVTGTPALDRLLAGQLGIAGGARVLAGGGWGFDNLRLTGRHAMATANGSVTPATADLTANIAAPDIHIVDERLAGSASADLRLSGSLSKLDASVRAALADGRLLDRPVPRLTLDATASDLTGTLAANASLNGAVGGKPLAGRVALRRAAAGWSLDTMDFSAGSATLKGTLTLDDAQRAAGSLHFAAADLDDLSALALTKLAGDVDVDLTLAATNGGQDVRLAAKANRVRAASVEVSSLVATLAGQDLLRRPKLDADVKVGKALAGGETIESISLTARNNGEASDIDLSARARSLDIVSRGRLFAGPPVRLDLQTLDARRDGHRIALAAPTSITVADGGATLARTVLGVDSGRVTAEGSIGQKLALAVTANAVPLSAARIAVPSLDLAGTLDAEARLGGTAQAPTGPWRVAVKNVSMPQFRQSGLPAAQASASGELQGDRTSLDGRVTLGSATTLTARGTAPLNAAGPLDLAVAGKLDAGLANATLAPQGRRLTGTLSIDAKLSGNAAKPVASGSASLANGSFSDALQGVKLDGMTASITARGDALTIDRFSAQTPNNGTLSASGNVRLDPAAGFPGDITLRGDRAQLISNGIVTAVADLGLRLSGPLAQRPVINGRVGVRSIEVSVPDRLPASLKPLDNTRHLNPPPEVKARLAAEARAKRLAGARARNAAFLAALDVTVSAPGHVFVRGRGIDAELGGDLKVGGTSADPIVNGAFELRRGRLNVLTQRLDFSKGRVLFSGDPVPDLDFVASTQAAGVTANIVVTGKASEPAFAFTSQPDLPQDEVLSRLLFAKASGSLSAFQAVQLAQAAAQFAGGGGDDAFERLRKSLGVDNLDIQAGANGPTVGVSRYIGNNISVGVKAGTKPEDSGLSADLFISKHLRLQGEATAKGGGAAGVATEWEF